MDFISDFFFSDRKDNVNEELVKSFFKREVFRKKVLIFKNGDAKTRHYLIESGLMRMYVIDSAGKEFNVLFAKEKQLIGDLASPLATKFNLETIEDSVVHSISHENVVKLSELLNVMTPAPKGPMVRAYIFLQNRLVSILTKTAEENYLQLRQDYPKLIHRLPQYHIASYLGISAEFLSKIIAKNAKK